MTVAGEVVYGDNGLQAAADPPTSYDAFTICGTGKFVCRLQTTASGNKVDAIKSKIATELKKYDDAHASQAKFSPIADLVKCGP